MKFYKKLIGIVLTMILAFSVVACGGGGGGETPAAKDGQTPEEIIEAAQAKMREITSVESEMAMDMGMSMGEESVNIKTSADMVTFTDPMKLKMTMTMDMGEQLGGVQKMEIYADEVDGNTTMYMSAMDSWYKQVVPSEQLAEYDTQDNLITYLDNSTGLKEAGTEQVNGAEATKYEGVISGSKMKETLEASGALDDLQPMLAGTDLEASDIYEGLSDIKVNVCIDTEGYPVKYEMDMKDMMQGLMDKIAQASGAEGAEQSISVDNFKISITSKNFNNATDFEIPEEAKNGTEM